MEWYWSRHTVNSRPFKSAGKSEAYLAWRFQQYPLFVSSWTCGVTTMDKRFSTTAAAQGRASLAFSSTPAPGALIGLDVSPKALDLTHRRLQLHEDRSRSL